MLVEAATYAGNKRLPRFQVRYSIYVAEMIPLSAAVCVS